ncbi:MAG: hypothetical protein JWM32_883 [Verrucomicrobia bacterium]|nr:hypothetical protein [Verrucomicrobiota bacterium]
MLKKILLIIAAALVIFLVVVALQPSDFKVTRSIAIAAPAPTIFSRVNDFHQWSAWSPWEKMDPAMKRTFEGPPSGVGTMYGWEGNNEVGSGKMTITESRPSDLIRIQLDFLKPMPSTCVSEFSFQPSGGQTLVTWTMSGKKNYVSKAFCMFMNMDKMVGGEFEKGLADLKRVSETPAK